MLKSSIYSININLTFLCGFVRLPSSQRTWTRLYDYAWANDRYCKVFFLLGVYKESAHRIVQSITASLNESNKTLGLEFVVFYTSHSSNLHVKRRFVFWLSFEVTSHFMSSLQQQQLKLLLVKHCGFFFYIFFLNRWPISFKELFLNEMFNLHHFIKQLRLSLLHNPEQNYINTEKWSFHVVIKISIKEKVREKSS